LADLQVDGVDFGDAIGDFGDASQPKGPSRREHFLNKHVHVRDGPAELDGDGCAGENAAAVDVRVQRLPADRVVLEQVDEAGIAEDNGAHKLEMQLQAVTEAANFPMRATRQGRLWQSQSLLSCASIIGVPTDVVGLFEHT